MDVGSGTRSTQKQLKQNFFYMFRAADSRRGEGWSEQGGGRGLYPAPATGPEGMKIFAHIVLKKNREIHLY
jgi:hypothetical protein